MSCTIDGCNKKVTARGWCNSHYLRWNRHGSPEGGAQGRHSTPSDALSARTVREGDCLVWAGARDSSGYGHLKAAGRRVAAHRLAWELSNGPIPPGLHLDHICWNKACCEVSHLRLATHAQNVRYQSGRPINNTSGFRGVYRKRSKWAVRVSRDGTVHSLYGFATAEEANEAAIRLRDELFGEFAGRG